MRRHAPGARGLRQLPLARRGFGDRVRVIREYADDEPNTETTTVLQMHVGGPGRRRRGPRDSLARRSRGAHRVRRHRRRAADDPLRAGDRRAGRRSRSIVTEGDDDRAARAAASGARWTASTATTSSAHRIAPTPEQAVDEAIAAGRISRELPFVRREGVRLVKARPYRARTRDAGDRRGTAEVLRRRRGGAIDGRRRRSGGRPRCRTCTGATCFPSMKVTWGAYPGQPRPHDVERLLPLPRWQPQGEGRQRRSAPTASTATSRSKNPDASHARARVQPRHAIALLRNSSASASRRAVDVLVAKAVAAIAHPADLLAAGANGRQPSEARWAVERVEVDARAPRRAVVLSFRYI